MPSSAAVLEQLTDILVTVVDCPTDAVVPDATLASLGTDSLTIVEVGEELGRRFDVYLSDDTIDRMKTVRDAVNAVVRHDGSKPPAGAFSVPASLGGPTTEAPAPQGTAPREVAPVNEEERAHRRGTAVSLLLAFAFVGVVIGGVIGIGGAALVSATGIDQVDLPPIVAPTTPEPTEEPTPSAPTSAPTSTTGEPEPSISASSDRVSPGERFILTGAFPASDAGEDLQVEVRDEGADWDEFPIQTKTRDGGTFKTELYTSRTGEREFRVTNMTTDMSSPSVKVSIG